MIIKGVARFHKDKRNHIITTQTVRPPVFFSLLPCFSLFPHPTDRNCLTYPTHPSQEHKCVLDSCRKLSEEGFEITYLPVQRDGLISLSTLEAAIRPQQTILVSIMAVNNETGVIQPLQQIGELVKKHRGVYFHTDAAQALGKIPLDVEKMHIDAMSLSGHKIYGPKGVGAAYVRRRPRVRLEPIMSGGGQERGLRSGTLPSTLVVGMGEACRIAKKEMEVSRAPT